MEFINSMSDSQNFYETVQWAVIIGINMIMLLFAYWLCDIAMLMQSRYRRWVTTSLAFGCAGIGIWRMIAVVIYFDSFTARLAVPVTAALTWIAIGIVGFVSHRYIKSVNARFIARKENLDLMDAVQHEIVEPLLRGEPVSKELIATHKARSLAYANGHK